MANEYLKRTPTSTGNRKVWTWSGWVKRNTLSSYQSLWADDKLVNFSNIYFLNNDEIGFNAGTSASNPVIKTAGVAFRDTANWMHLLFVMDTTNSIDTERLRIYINGIRQKQTTTSAYPTINFEGDFNKSGQTFFIGNQSAYSYYLKSEIKDVFLVDGQALTPDVFGYYKKGDGYISAGSTQATDFKKGQWVPKAPKVIKSVINARGGFGVNGFYLPMNDSTNVGADLHCTPNSIIKLKGEDEPQPYYGAPTTTDAYVSQLRADPYAANLVLAVPGISTATGPNLIDNGTFDSNTNNWTAGNSAILSVVNSALKIQSSPTVINGFAVQPITTVVGKRYTVSFDVVDSSSSAAWVRIGTTSGGVQVTSRNNNTQGKHTLSFDATSTVTYISFMVTVGIVDRYTVVDNIVVKQEDAPRDYSADIKGSGTNKTLVANGNAGVGYEIPSYYGSAMSFDGDSDYLTSPPNVDFSVGTEDFTIEFWMRRFDTGTNVGVIDTRSTNTDTNAWFIRCNSSTTIQFVDNATQYVTLTHTSDWNHVAFVRKSGVLTGYMNGVASAINTGVTKNFSSINLLIGGFTDVQSTPNAYFGVLQDLRVYKGVAKYKGGFDVPKPYTPVGISTWRAVPDCTANNFCTWNALIPSPDTLTDGNLTVAGGAGEFSQGTIGISSALGNKWYFEFYASNASGARAGAVGWATTSYDITSTGYFSYRSNSGNYYPPNTAYGDSWTTGDIIGIALDADNGRIFASKNGVWQNSGDPVAGTNPMASNIFNGLTDSVLVPLVEGYGSGGPAGSANFGQNPTFSGNTTAGTFTDSNGKGLFKYQPPTGFLALCEDNLPTPAIADPGKHFKTVLYTGDDSDSMKITGVGFKPDLVWVKKRTGGSQNHTLYDSVRGADKRLMPNVTNEESSVTDYIRSFDNDGFSIGGNNFVNDVGQNYVAWCWKAGNAAVSNTDGSITSQVSVNQDAGFSIVSWTGNGSAGTVGHGLGKTPSFLIVKNRTDSTNWFIRHSGYDVGGNSRLVFDASVGSQQDNPWNNSYWNATTFPVGDQNWTNGSSDNMIAYCWAEIEGFSKFGSYVGNAGADGPFVYCGFKPAWVMIKNVTLGGYWNIWDSSRTSTNPCDKVIFPSAPDIEAFGSGYRTDFLSNGFKIRTGSASHINGIGETIIFAAFAESPFQTANSK